MTVLRTKGDAQPAMPGGRVRLERVSEGHTDPPDSGQDETRRHAGEGVTQPPPERPLHELSDQELKARGYTRETFNDFLLVIRRSSFLLGLFGLPPEVQRYRDGAVDARAVVKALVQVRVAYAPAAFSYTAEQFNDLVRLVASVSVEPRLPTGSFAEVADALAEEQRHLEEQVVAPFVKARDMARAGAKGFDGLRRRVSEAIEASPLSRFLLPPRQGPHPELPPGLGLSGFDWSEDRFRPYRMRDYPSNLGRSGKEYEARQTGQVDLQRQLMGPSSLGRAIGDVVTRLQVASVTPPDSVSRLRGKSTVTLEETRAAAVDAAELARREGYHDAADLLDLTNSTIESSRGLGGTTAEQEKVLAEKAIQFYTNIAPQMASDRKFNAIMALVAFVMFLAQLGAPYVLPDPYPQSPEPHRALPRPSSEPDGSQSLPSTSDDGFNGRKDQRQNLAEPPSEPRSSPSRRTPRDPRRDLE